MEMKRIFRVAHWLFTIGCLCIISVFAYFDLSDYVNYKLNPITFLPEDYPIEEYASLLEEAGIQMLKNEQPEMVECDDKSFVFQFSRFKQRDTYDKSWYYNFPKVFLYIGFINKYQGHIPDEVNKLFDKYFVEAYKKSYDLNWVGRVSISYAALRLYETTRDEKYLPLINDGYQSIIQSVAADGLIHYGPKDACLYVDGLGMYIPFLVEYYKYFQDPAALRLAEENFDYYCLHGTSDHLPHWFIKEGIGIGNNGWGRGIGWYAIGLMSLYDYDEKYQTEARSLCDTLLKLQMAPYEWAQVLGHNNHFDSTSTLPFLLLLHKAYPDRIKNDKEQIVRMLITKTLSDGSLYYASGDSWRPPYLNREYGKSEFSQGLVLWLLSELENQL